MDEIKSVDRFKVQKRTQNMLMNQTSKEKLSSGACCLCVMSITYLVSPSPSVVIFVTVAIMYDIVPCIHSEQSLSSHNTNNPSQLAGQSFSILL